MRFDPEASARETGHEHEIPPDVKPLSAQGHKDFEAWAKAAVEERDQRGSPEITVETARTALDFLKVLADKVGSARRFVEAAPANPKAQLALWDALTEMHLLIDRIEILMLTELYPSGWPIPLAKPSRRRPIP